MRRRRRADGERGALMVEMAIVAPLLALVIAGVLEFGLAWRDNLTVANAGRAGVRTVSRGGDDRLADYETLQSVRGALNSIDPGLIDYLVIYESTTADGGPSPTCAAGSTSTVPGERCNVYSASDLSTLVPADFTGTTDCSTAPDRFFCPVTDRETDFDIGPGYVGVHLSVNRDFITGAFPGSITITDHSVMRLEPVIS